MFRTDGQQIWVRQQIAPGDWGPDHELNWPVGFVNRKGMPAVDSINGMPPVVITAPGNYLMLFFISFVGELWRGRYDGGQNPIVWENAGGPPGAYLGGTSAPVVSIGTTGNIEVFAISDQGDLWQMWHTTETGAWSDWY